MSEAVHLVCPHCAAVNRLSPERLSAAPKCGKCKEMLFVGASRAVDPSAFEKHLTRNDIPLLVDFWAPWCGPCKMMAPAFEQAAQELEPQVRLLKVDTEQHQALAMRYAIRSIPTLIVFKGGREIARESGALDVGRMIALVRGASG